jgi:Plasmid replication region DNA-binding N-term
MEKAQVEAAVLTLLQQGLTWDEISAPKVRELLGRGSFRDICQHIATLRAELPEELMAASVATTAGSPETPPGQADPDPVAEAEQALAAAQQALQAKMDALPEAEHELADARARVLAAVSNQLAMVEASRRGLLGSEDPGRSEAAAEVDEAAHAYRQARQHWRWALDGVEGFGQRVREAQASLQEARRQHFLQTHHPELLAELAEALQRQCDDPWLQPTSDLRSVQAAQHRYQHDYRLQEIRQRLQAVCEQAGL